MLSIDREKRLWFVFSGDSDPADIYYCKKMVEYILLTFQEMEENLHTTDFSKYMIVVYHDIVLYLLSVYLLFVSFSLLCVRLTSRSCKSYLKVISDPFLFQIGFIYGYIWKVGKITGVLIENWERKLRV